MATPPDFSVAQVLTAAHMNAVGLWLVKTQTIGTAVTDVTVTGAFSADYDVYKITVTGGAGSAGGSLELQLGTTTTGYYAAMSGVTYATTAAALTADNNAARWTNAGSINTSSLSMNIELTNPFLTENTFIFGQGLTGTVTGRTLTGILNDTTSYTGFKIFASGANTLTGGTIRVYGYRN
jgi:hypothetical protein